MSFHRTVAALHQRAGPITLAYKRRAMSANFRLDKEQLSLSATLDTLYSSLASSNDQFLIPDGHIETAARYYGGPSSSLTTDNFAGKAIATAHSFVNTSPKGVYIHGSVGVGKSMIMDLFYSICADGLTIPEEEIEYTPIKRSRKRCHFHEFMLDVHQRIHAYKRIHPREDPIPPVAASLAKEARLLCFDEMQITDIADAMIMKRLLTILLDLGVVVVTTSNRPPSGLYEGGINRSIFLPLIDTLRERMMVIEMGGTHDYRRDCLANSDSDASSLPPYLCTSTNPSSHEILKQWFSKGAGETRNESIPVAMGRSVLVTRANDSCGWFSFNELCYQPLGAADYIAIADRFDTIIVDNVPQLGGNTYNEARRFVTLIDALYEAKTKLILASEVPMGELFVGFDATVETSDGDEEIAIEDNNSALGKESVVIGEGGSSSSSSTTLIHTQNGEMEWSATGRIGVSLAQLSAVREVSFSFMRAASRLAEMAAANWGR
jgi:protein AFG1